MGKNELNQFAFEIRNCLPGRRCLKLHKRSVKEWFPVLWILLTLGPRPSWLRRRIYKVLRRPNGGHLCPEERDSTLYTEASAVILCQKFISF